MAGISHSDPARDVVITGMGLVTPLGRSLDENWRNLKAGKTGLDRHPRKSAPGRLEHYGRVSGLDTVADVPGKLASQTRFLNRGSLLGFEAAREALRLADLNPDAIPPGRRALYVASGDMTNAGCDFMRPATRDEPLLDGEAAGPVDFKSFNKAVLDKVNPFFLLESIHNNLFSFLSAAVQFMGPNTSLASLSPCGSHAIELAARSIAEGDADVALAVGCGSWIGDVSLHEMKGLGILSACRQGARSFRPFDRERDGFIPSEGGAALLLEPAGPARERGARLWGRIKGFGNRMEISTSRGVGVPDQVGRRSMLMALEEAGCELLDLAFISPHGSATVKGDRAELRAIAEILSDYGFDSTMRLPVCGLKPYTGHMAAASDVAEVIFGLMALRDGMAPGTPHFEKAERGFEALNIASSSLSVEKTHFVSTSYGILGETSSVVVEAFRE